MPSPTVAAYFERVLGRPLRDPQTSDPGDPRTFSPYHPRFTVDTGCGTSCKAAIDAAAALVGHVRDAFGRNSDPEREVVYATERVVLCFVYG